MLMDVRHPHLVVIGGPNGAGKSTMATSLLKGTLAEPHLIAYGEQERQLVVRDKIIWHNIKHRYGETEKI